MNTLPFYRKTVILFNNFAFHKEGLPELYVKSANFVNVLYFSNWG